MKILSIDTSADETSAAVSENLKILTNIVWSQASLHAKWGGVVPSLAQRMHTQRIGFVVKKALGKLDIRKDIDAVAVTVGPGLAIALGVGIEKAKELAKKYKKPLIAVNHVEGHILSPLAKNEIDFPAFGLVVSGGNTILALIEAPGKYKVLAQTRDDALGEALDKAGRMLGLGYPAGAVVEKLAKEGNPKKYPLPIPIVGREKEMFFTYSGLKTAMYRLVENLKPLTKEKIQNLCASFQNSAFEHLVRVVRFAIKNEGSKAKFLLVGGGVSANNELRKKLRRIGRQLGIKVLFPYSKRLCGDNAAMIGIAAFFKSQRNEFAESIDAVDRIPGLKLQMPSERGSRVFTK